MTTATRPVSADRGSELLGQTVVLIGGSAGIGLETARRARAEGAEVVLVGRHPERLQEAALDVGAQRTAAVDANDPAAVREFFDGLPGPIDHVLITAGGPRRDQLRATLPIGRVVGPADVAALAVHLMTNTALTGATFDIDGGQQFVS
jgi:NAD(P)-dependent dehydrogenase (short-subunit alcohol dehydrogenase family)